jgi:tetratricopeptide (TPR) repeat protein
MALDEGIQELRLSYVDNFWETLSIERLAIDKDKPQDAKAIKDGEGVRNPKFDRAEEKAIKAIQKRSMNLGGREVNTQIDEAHLLLGKARYYEQRFVPATEAFNYILYKNPDSDKIYEAKIWKEKTNIRLENNEIAIRNLQKLLSEIDFKDQVFADTHAALAQAYLNIQQPEDALKSLKLALEFTKIKEERARYRFIIGQIYAELDDDKNAALYFQSVIDMKRKSPRRYVINAHSALASQINPAKDDTVIFFEKFNKLLKDRENRAFLDVLYHRLGLYYDKQAKDNQSIAYYNKSLRNPSPDVYMKASNYRNIGEINFYNAVYKTAGLYYDSTLIFLTPRTREHRLIQKKRDNLEDVIKYEAIANANDSIIRIYKMSVPAQEAFFQTYIDGLIAQKELDKKNEAALDKERESNPDAKENSFSPNNDALATKKAAMSGPADFGMDDNFDSNPKGNSNFYFYNATTVAFGKKEFEKVWGRTTIKDNWRFSAIPSKITFGDENIEEQTDPFLEEADENKDVKEKEEPIDIRHTIDYYLSQLPKTKIEKDSIQKERNFAYYQLGTIYFEKFKEYNLATDKFEGLLTSNPEERLILPSIYNLYKIYTLQKNPRADFYKSKITTEHADSRYAQIINNPNLKNYLTENDPISVYKRLYNEFEKADDYNLLLAQLEQVIFNFNGEDIVPKFELLKASTLGKLEGLEAYKEALNEVALNYPNNQEGKDAEDLLKTQVPKLEALSFGAKPASGWRLVWDLSKIENSKVVALMPILQTFVDSGINENLKLTVEKYKENNELIVIQGIKSTAQLEEYTTILRDYKDYQIQDIYLIISTEDYEVAQIKKNLSQYINQALKP